ncbi:GGDEF domain protein [hydrothermal vent metagenome]|uniref:GGDEF domain protein n=1 Tax=hydrothermal vent metagenome TaxID=652676 RepID=A0A3B1BS11_9ZZZZ
MDISAHKGDELRSISTVLDSLDALVYVCDMDTYEIIFFNQYGKSIWGNAQGRTCWKVLQSEQTGPCSFCSNDRLIDESGKSTGVYVWEFQNTVNGHWYQCRDQAIRWVDGRLVRMEIATDITERKQTEDDLKQAKEIAEQLARTDELTSLNNRRAFFELGEKAFQHARRFNSNLSLIMLDLDYFKKINDHHGHAAGDKVLQTLGGLLKQSNREIDIIGRLGGEEFALILPETDLPGAIELAERLRQNVSGLLVKLGNTDIKFTISIGIAELQAENKTLDDLLLQADNALYTAKRNGRNCIEGPDKQDNSIHID